VIRLPAAWPVRGISLKLTIFQTYFGETVSRIEEAGRGGFMRRFLTLVCLLCLAIPAGISVSGCARNPDANYCNGEGYGLKITDVYTILLLSQQRTYQISLAYGQTQALPTPTAQNCKGATAPVTSFNYGTTNNQLVDVSPTGNICAGTWNRNSGGGVPNYTYCSYPDPAPSTGGLPYGIAYVTASVNAVTSNPLTVYVHPQVTSVSLVTEPATGTAQQCFSQNTVATLDAQACFIGSNSQSQLLCAPPSVTASSNPGYACPLPPGVTSVPDCLASIGNLNYSIGTPAIASLNNETNQITAEFPGTTVINASIAGGNSSAGYFSTCPPASISVKLANGETTGTISQGVTQNLTTTILDTNGNTITGLVLDYQSTDPIDISAGAGGTITTAFSGTASVYAICQPTTCNPAPNNLFGLYGTGLSVSSNPVHITVPPTASDYLWFAAPGQSQYVIPIELLNGSSGSTVRLPYVPNSMQMDRLGSNIYFGSPHELMILSTSNNAVTKQDASVPGVVLAVAPNNEQLLINDQLRQVFYLYSQTGGISEAFGGVGNAAAYTPDGQTLYITDSAALNNTPENIAAGINGHSDTLYVYNVNTGWSTYPLACSVYNAVTCPSPTSTTGAQNLAITIPGVGAFLSGEPTVAHTWCPTGQVGNAASLQYYPQTPPDNSVDANTDVLAATTDGNHVLGAALSGIGPDITLSDIGLTIPSFNCLPPEASPNYSLALGDTFSPLALATTLNQSAVTADAVAINQVVPAPASNLAFITYNPPATGAATGVPLPYYVPGACTPVTDAPPDCQNGTVNYVTLKNGSSASTTDTAPLTGAFSPDSSYFFVSTAGDNMIHFISIPKVISPATPLVDTQQLSPNLPSCISVANGGTDAGCIYSGPNPGTAVVPATVIEVKPRSTT
jgi:hypothetical protein